VHYIRIGALALLAAVSVMGIRVFTDVRVIAPTLFSALGYALYAVSNVLQQKLPHWTVFVPVLATGASAVAIMFNPYGFEMMSFAFGVIGAILYAAYSFLLFLPSLMNKD
jgi:hypothetical protein